MTEYDNSQDDSIIIKPKETITIEPTESLYIEPLINEQLDSITITPDTNHYFSETNEQKSIENISQNSLLLPQDSDIQDELKEWGWKKTKVRINQNTIKECYQGMFKGLNGSYKGFVWEDSNSVLIKNPPLSALNGRAGLCISETSRGWYIINFKKGNNVLGRIAEVERYLKEVGA